MFNFFNIGQLKTNCFFLLALLLIISFSSAAQRKKEEFQSVAPSQKGQILNACDYAQKIATLRKEILAAHRKAYALQNKLERRTSFIYITLSVGQCFLLLGGVIIVRLTRKRKIEIIRRKAAERTVHVLKRASAKNIRSLQQQKKVLKMQALRSQMNPHFIFNSLNSINRFILQKDTRQASEYLVKFSKLIRQVLQNSQEAAVKLEEEIAFLDLYLKLEALRCDQRFTFSINVDKGLDLSVVKVPPLLIQPYLENAIWHGFTHIEENGALNVDFSIKGEWLYCKITDNGMGRKKAAEAKREPAGTYKSIGMSATAERIKLSQRKKQHQNKVIINDLVLPDGSACGTEILLTIPVHYDKSYHN